jgi:hypothetical protein
MVMELALSKVRQVSLAAKHSACITDGFSLFTWGAGSFGRLATRGTSQKHVPTLVKILVRAKKAQRTLEGIPSSSSDSESDSDTSNDDHHMGPLRDTDGDGRIDIADLVNSAEGFRVRSVAVSDSRIAAVTTGGKLFLAGRQFVTASGFVEDWVRPRQVRGFDAPVAKVALRDRVAAVVTRTGALWTWGSNTCSVLGHGSAFQQTKEIMAPRRVRALTGLVVTSVGLGTTHAACATRSGRLFTWGFDPCGAHGRGDDFTATQSDGGRFREPTPFAPLAPWTAAQVSCAACSTAVVVGAQTLGFAPVFRADGQPPARLTVCAGMTIRIPVRAKGLAPVPSAKWTLDGAPVVNENPASRADRLERRARRLDAARPADDGQDGPDPADDATADDATADDAAADDAAADDAAADDAAADDDGRPARRRRVKGRREKTASDPLEGAHDLVVSSAQAAHEGEWRCTLVNRVGSCTSAACRVTVVSLERWANAAAEESAAARAALAACRARRDRLRSASERHLLVAKQQAGEALDAARDAVVLAQTAHREAKIRAAEATAEAESMSQEQHRQLKFCRYTQTSVAKRGMAVATRQVAEAWEAAARAEDEATDAARAAARAAASLEERKRALAQATQRAQEPEDRIAASEAELEACRRRGEAAQSALAIANEMMDAAKAELVRACSPADEGAPLRVVAAFEAHTGWCESAVLSIRALQTLTTLASASARTLAAVCASGADALADRVAASMQAVGAADGPSATVARMGGADGLGRRQLELRSRAGRLALGLKAILATSASIAGAAKRADVDTVDAVTEGMLMHPGVGSIQEIGCDVLARESVAASTRSAAQAHRAVDALRAAAEAGGEGGRPARLAAMRELYGVLAWAFESGLGEHTQRLIQAHLVRMQWIRDGGLCAELMRDWGMSDAQIARVERAIEALPPEGAADMDRLEDMLRRARLEGRSRDELKALLESAMARAERGRRRGPR